MQRVIFETDGEYTRFRQVVVNVVMATDIFDKELSDLRKKRWEKAFDPEHSDEDDENRKATIAIAHYAGLGRGTHDAALARVPEMEPPFV